MGPKDNMYIAWKYEGEKKNHNSQGGKTSIDYASKTHHPFNMYNMFFFH